MSFTNFPTISIVSSEKISVEKLKSSLELARTSYESYKAKRDANFQDIGKQGYLVFGVEGTDGETWVVDDRIFNQLFYAVESRGYVPFQNRLTGVRMIRASEYFPKPQAAAEKVSGE